MAEQQRRGLPPEPPEPDTARLADLPVDELPPDAPDRAHAAVDDVPDDLDAGALAHEPGASRDPKAVMAAYAAALADGDAALAADLFAERSLLVTSGPHLSGRAAIAGWHRDLLGRGAVRARPAGQGSDQGRLEVDGPDGPRVVELAFDASGRIGTARWLTLEQASRPQEERQRTPR
jgi:hypothetical protein